MFRLLTGPKKIFKFSMVRVFWWSKNNFQFFFVNQKLKISLGRLETLTIKILKIFLELREYPNYKNFENFLGYREYPNHKKF